MPHNVVKDLRGPDDRFAVTMHLGRHGAFVSDSTSCGGSYALPQA